MIVFAHFCSEVYRAKGRPKLSVLAQVLHLIVLVPACIASSGYGFWPLIYTRALIRIQVVSVHFILMKYIMNFSFKQTFKNVYFTIICSILMGILGHLLLTVNKSFVWSIVSVMICSLFYFSILFIYKDMRMELINISKKVLPGTVKQKIRLVIYKFTY